MAATYTSPLLLEFAAGALLHEAWERRLLPEGRAALAVLAFAVACLAAQEAWGGPEHRFAVWGVVSVLLLGGALGAERSGHVPRMRALGVVGDASFSIYLFQFFALNALERRLAAWPEVAALPAKLAGCTALGLAFYVLLERPLQRLGARLRIGRSAKVIAANP